MTVAEDRLIELMFPHQFKRTHRTLNRLVVWGFKPVGDDDPPDTKYPLRVHLAERAWDVREKLATYTVTHR